MTTDNDNAVRVAEMSECSVEVEAAAEALEEASEVKKAARDRYKAALSRMRDFAKVLPLLDG